MGLSRLACLPSFLAVACGWVSDFDATPFSLEGVFRLESFRVVCFSSFSVQYLGHAFSIAFHTLSALRCPSEPPSTSSEPINRVSRSPLSPMIKCPLFSCLLRLAIFAFMLSPSGIGSRVASGEDSSLVVFAADCGAFFVVFFVLSLELTLAVLSGMPMVVPWLESLLPIVSFCCLTVPSASASCVALPNAFSAAPAVGGRTAVGGSAGRVLLATIYFGTLFAGFLLLHSLSPGYSAHATENDTIGGYGPVTTTHPWQCFVFGQTVLIRRDGFGGFPEARNNTIYHAIRPPCEIFKHFSLSASPILLSYAHTELTATS
ncbi:hypothetical protein KC326_g140 [Hortaea werneckii]|nr:hypothetical protein KC326_g140 [Hortaea werneckii]